MNTFIDSMESNISSKLHDIFTSPSNYLNSVTISFLIMLGTYVVYWLINALSIKHIKNIKKQYEVRRRLKRFLILVSAIFIFIIWLNALNTLVIILIVLSLFFIAVIRGILNNIIAWFIITQKNYFKVGDRIEIEDSIGEVISIDYFYFELAELKGWLSSEALTGRKKRYPNHIIFDTSISTYSELSDFIWHELTFVLSHDSNWEEAKRILLDVLDTYTEEELLPLVEKYEAKPVLDALKTNTDSVFNILVSHDGLALSIRYMVYYKESAKVKTILTELILKQFEKESDIHFAVHDIREIT